MDHLLVELRNIIKDYYAKLGDVPDSLAATSMKDGGWSRKEMLGHLLDSALNNHQRFVRAIIDGSVTFPAYDQNAWVNVQDYRTKNWVDLIVLWRTLNQLLLHVMSRAPRERFAAPCTIGDKPTVTLQELFADYLSHMHHHLDAIVG